jgi:nucleoside-diphosphate-sugar epimerase
LCGIEHGGSGIAAVKFLVTGATGLVGSHTARALLEGGHAVRFYVRDPLALRRHFAALGHAVDDIVTGDIRDRERVGAALVGCDGVAHAAALVSLNPNDTRAMEEINDGGTRIVLGAACAAGLSKILYVSSLSVFFRPGAHMIDESTVLATPREAYARTKRAAEDFARGLQEAGAPVTITYPAAVFGPDDPKLSESNHALMNFVAQMLPKTSSGMQGVDARDVALAHQHLLEREAGPAPQEARYILGGYYYPWAELGAILEAVLQRRLKSLAIPGGLLRGVGTLADWVRPVIGGSGQISADAMAIATRWTPADSTRFLTSTGLRFRPGAETFADTIGWLARAGHLTRAQAGALAPP